MTGEQTGFLNLTLSSGSSSLSTGEHGVAVAEIVPSGDSSPTGPAPGDEPTTVTVGINHTQAVPLGHGNYTVRLFLPSGSVLAESVAIVPGEQKQLTFTLPRSPTDWLGSEFLRGDVQTLPSFERVRDLHARVEEDNSRTGQRTLESLGPIAGDETKSFSSSDLAGALEPGFSSVVRAAYVSAAVDSARGYQRLREIGGADQVSKMSARLVRYTARTPKPDLQTLSTESWGRRRDRAFMFAEWWMGAQTGQDALPFTMHDDHNAKLSLPIAWTGGLQGERRTFLRVGDPAGGEHIAVLPEGWTTADGRRVSSTAIMTVLVNAVWQEENEQEAPVRWACVTGVDDAASMSFLSFLQSRRLEAADVMLRDVRERLFNKLDNPVAAAGAAFALLSGPEDLNDRRSPDWRAWIRNLYSVAPHLPDGAIAMAKLCIRYGNESQSADEVDIEELRSYALEAVRRGMPFLTYGIKTLSEVLLMLVREDESCKRSGDFVEQTRNAQMLVRGLGRLVDSDRVFTTLRIGAG